MDKRTQETLKRHAEGDQVMLDTPKHKKIYLTDMRGTIVWSPEQTTPDDICYTLESERITAAEERDALREKVEDWQNIAAGIKAIFTTIEDSDKAISKAIDLIDDGFSYMPAAKERLSQSNKEPSG